MAVMIHRGPQLHKCLTKLRRAGGRAALAAQRIDTIIATLATDASRRPAEVHKLTRRGEARIEHCKKFDLVGGYRLVYVKEDHRYCFLFAGTHDDCDRWLDHHKDLKPAMPSAAPAAEVVQTEAVTPLVEPAEPAEALDYDDILMQQIDEHMLRRVFRGLCGE
jgi:hypothetical protein